MSRYDVVVIGGGVGGCTAGALLSKLGKSVVVLEKDSQVSGRCIDIPYKGYTLNLGGHLIVDPGSGITKVFDYLGKKLEFGPINDTLSLYHEGEWVPINEMYAGIKDEIRGVIKEIVSSDFSEFDRYENVPLRYWVRERTDSEEILALYEILAGLEFQTSEWYDHSASEFLYMRKMHYQEKRMAAFSFWPKAGLLGLVKILVDSIEENGGEVRTDSKATELIVKDNKVRGVRVQKSPKLTPNEYPETEVIEADNVICTIPIWNVLDIVSEDLLPPWFVAKIKYLAQDQFRDSWYGFYAGLDKPIYGLSEHEIASWTKDGTRTGQSGYLYLQSAFDRSMAPEGKHLMICGSYVRDPLLMKDRQWLERKFEELDLDMEERFPDLKEHCLWKSRHLIWDCGIFSKPGLVGSIRPDNRVPNVEGLYLGGDTARGISVGMDRAARTALTCTELILGERLPEFKDSPHL